MRYYQAAKSADDPLIGVAHMVADTIMAIGGPLFWGALVIALLTSLFRWTWKLRSTSGRSLNLWEVGARIDLHQMIRLASSV
jgi:hypothetical protein